MIRKATVLLSILFLSVGGSISAEQLMLGSLATQDQKHSIFIPNPENETQFFDLRIESSYFTFSGEYHNFVDGEQKYYYGGSFEFGSGNSELCIDLCLDLDVTRWTISGFFGRKLGNTTPYVRFIAYSLNHDDEEDFDTNAILDTGQVEWDFDLGLWLGNKDRRWRFSLDQIVNANDIHRTISVASFWTLQDDFVFAPQISLPISTESHEKSLKLTISVGRYF